MRSQTRWKWASRAVLLSLALLGVARAPGFVAGALYTLVAVWIVRSRDAEIRRKFRGAAWIYFCAAPFAPFGTTAGFVEITLYGGLAALGVALLGLLMPAYAHPARAYRSLAPLVLLAVVSILAAAHIPAAFKLVLVAAAAWILLREALSLDTEPNDIAVKPLIEAGIGALVITELVWAASFLPLAPFHLGIWAAILLIATEMALDAHKKGLAGRRLILEKSLILSGFLVLLLIASII